MAFSRLLQAMQTLSADSCCFPAAVWFSMPYLSDLSFQSQYVPPAAAELLTLTLGGHAYWTQ